MYQGDKIAGDMGKTAGRNLSEQIKFFNKCGTDSKIIPIVQGQGDGEKNYALNMLSELTKKQLDQLEHISLGGIIWEHSFSILEKAVNVYQMDGVPQSMLKNLHLLGVTGFRKSLPTIVGFRNGLFPHLKRLSFDSTKLMRSYAFGFVQPSIHDAIARKPYTILGKVRTAEVEDYYEELWNFWKDMPENVFENVEDMIEHSCYNSRGLNTETKIYNVLGLEAGIKSVAQTIYYVHYNTFKFLQILDMFFCGKIKLSEFMGNYKDVHLLESLEKIKCVYDFHQWYNSSVKQMVEESKTRRDPLSGIRATSFLF